MAMREHAAVQIEPIVEAACWGIKAAAPSASWRHGGFPAPVHAPGFGQPLLIRCVEARWAAGACGAQAAISTEGGTQQTPTASSVMPSVLAGSGSGSGAFFPQVSTASASVESMSMSCCCAMRSDDGDEIGGGINGLFHSVR